VVIELQVVAGDPDGRQIAVSTTIELDATRAGWHTWLVDAVTAQAEEAARRLRQQLSAELPLAHDGFVPLAAVVPLVSDR